jgi:hypothetical protein
MANYNILVSNFVDETAKAKVDKYFLHNEYNKFWNKFISIKGNPTSLAKNPVLDIKEQFKLKGIQWGRWVTIEDRVNYLTLMYYSLKDMNTILKFPKDNLGLDGTLALTVGSRGVKGALAHYEPSYNVINLSRYNKAIGRYKGTDKEYRFANTGGAGSLAHEYGHFIDYFFGRYAKPSFDGVYDGFLSGGGYIGLARGIDKNKPNKNQLVFKMSNLMDSIIYKNKIGAIGKSTELSNYYKGLAKTHAPKYFMMRTEIFARTFEQYISEKIKKKGIKNYFVSKQKYARAWYLGAEQYKKVEHYMDEVIKEMRKQF